MPRLLRTLVGVTVLGGSVAFVSSALAASGAERIPASVSYVRIAFRDTSDAAQNRTIVLGGSRAQHMVGLFDALRREPAGTVQCDAMSTSSTYVTFRGAGHTWVAHEAICTNLTVTRDGKSLPTLLESKAWNAALTHYIGHSPTATGSPAT